MAIMRKCVGTFAAFRNALRALLHVTLRAMLAAALVAPAMAQSDIVFVAGTGDPALAPAAPPAPAYRPFACSGFEAAKARLAAAYPVAPAFSPPPRLDRSLLDAALASFEKHICHQGSGTGPSLIVVVDYARRSPEPRLYIVDLESGQGLDTPVVVAHGIGSDPDDDGFADAFGDVRDSWMSSLGAARGGELYHGRNGLSLRLDGLDTSNVSMRQRDIVVHSYAPERRRYFHYSLLAARGGKPGASEGCFVVEPHRRDWLYDRLRDGGFLYAGLGRAALERRTQNLPPATGDVIFQPGTGR